jgi:ketosteroid isomerase-like protein
MVQFNPRTHRIGCGSDNSEETRVYRRIVAARTRAVWRAVAEGRREVPAELAAPDLRFEFVGDTPLSATLSGSDAFRTWFAAVYDRFPDLNFEVLDVAVSGMPWKTRVAVRLHVRATLADGTPYDNHACQWMTLRWGRMTEDWVLEDTVALQRACVIQAAAEASATP